MSGSEAGRPRNSILSIRQAPSHRIFRVLLSTLPALLLALPGWASAQQPDSADRPPGARSGDAPPPVRDMAALVAQLDSGSRAFEEGRLQDARRHHLRAVELAPELTSAWFGLFMVEDSLGNEAAADSALVQVRRISPGAIPPELQDRLPEPDP